MKLGQEFFRRCFSLPKRKFGLNYKKNLLTIFSISETRVLIYRYYSGRKVASCLGFNKK